MVPKMIKHNPKMASILYRNRLTIAPKASPKCLLEPLGLQVGFPTPIFPSWVLSWNLLVPSWVDLGAKLAPQNWSKIDQKSVQKRFFLISLRKGKNTSRMSFWALPSFKASQIGSQKGTKMPPASIQFVNCSIILNIFFDWLSMALHLVFKGISMDFQRFSKFSRIS